MYFMISIILTVVYKKKIPETQNYYINLLIETAGKHFYHTTKLFYFFLFKRKMKAYRRC